MELHLFEDTLADGDEIGLNATKARAIYVTGGSVEMDGKTYGADDGFLTVGELILKAGENGASLWRWDLSADRPSKPAQRTVSRLSGSVPSILADGNSFLRLDSVAFPPSGTAMLHTHQGPGIRCLREGSIRIDTEGRSTAFGPGGCWYEAGPLPVFAQADNDIPSRFIRAMVLPDALRGKSSIHYVNEADRAKPKSQTYRNFGEIGLAP